MQTLLLNVCELEKTRLRLIKYTCTFFTESTPSLPWVPSSKKRAKRREEKRERRGEKRREEKRREEEEKRREEKRREREEARKPLAACDNNLVPRAF